MDTQYNVVFTGKLREGFPLEDAVRDLATLSRKREEDVEKILTSGKKLVLQKNLDKEKATNYAQRLHKIGLEIKLARVQQETSEEEPTVAPAQQAPETAQQSETPPEQEKPAEPQPSARQTSSASANPYAAPEAELKTSGPVINGKVGDPGKMPASHGWLWIKDAIRLFLKSPWTWIGMMIVVGIISGILGLIPFIGFLLNTFISILLGAGMMIAAHELHETDELEFGTLFRGFTQGRNQLLIMAGLYLVGVIIIMLIVGFLIGGSVLLPMIGGGGNFSAVGFTAMLLGILIAALLFIPLIMAIWFGSCLITIGGYSAKDAMIASFHGCKKNILPYLVYCLAYLGLWIIIGIILAIFVGIGKAIGSTAGIIAAVIAVIVAIPLFVITMASVCLSIYTSFRDIFYIADR